jgi:hypothetical protein
VDGHKAQAYPIELLLFIIMMAEPAAHSSKAGQGFMFFERASTYLEA